MSLITELHQSSPTPAISSQPPRLVIKTKLVASLSYDREGLRPGRERSLNESSLSCDGLSSLDFYGCKFEHGLRKPVARSCKRAPRVIGDVPCPFFSLGITWWSVAATGDKASTGSIISNCKLSNASDKRDLAVMKETYRDYILICRYYLY